MRTTRIRYNETERHKILTAAAKLYAEYRGRSLKEYFMAAMRAGVEVSRWKDPNNIAPNTQPSYAWFRDAIGEISRRPEPRPEPPKSNIKQTSTADLIVELFNRTSMAYEATKGIPDTVRQLNARMLALETQTSRLAGTIHRIAQELGVDDLSIAELLDRDQIPEAMPPKPKQLHIKVIGPLPDQQRLIRTKVSGVKLSFLDSETTVNLNDFDGCDRAIIARHSNHAAYRAACNVLGRDKVIRLRSSGLDTIVRTISGLIQLQGQL